jgi:ABC-type phosphate transport system permease subunit
MQVRRTIITIVAAVTASFSPIQVVAQEVRLIGSGASFPFPIYSAWFKDFSKQNKGVAMKTVPRKMKDAALGMGCTKTQMIWKIVLPTALPGILTGIMLGIARVAGESAPLLFTALFSNYWLTSLREPAPSLSILIYNFSSMPFDNQIELAWAASLILVLMVLVFNIFSRVLGQSRI